ncbi:ATP-grasp domain-containing protein [Gimesia maris]|uniref:ATP-grasp domain-containing protein n=1 Tax=Gimesia maris TaxID=122 RepID=UPI0032EC2488
MSNLILFPHEAFSRSEIDSAFSEEHRAALKAGWKTVFYDHDALTQGDTGITVQGLPVTTLSQKLILRGWMLPGEIYAKLYESVRSKGYQLVTTPEAYEEAHYLPLAYPLIKEQTSRTTWISGDDIESAWQLYSNFADSDVIIKDWVKSAKNRWNDGCFIPAGTDEKRFKGIYKVFREERGNLFNRGIVLREFMPLISHGNDMRGMPLVEETRLFFWNGKPVVLPLPNSALPPDGIKRWEDIAGRFKSPFITIDVAALTDGTYKIVETGDGGVSGLPVDLNPMLFYRSLSECVNQ